MLGKHELRLINISLKAAWSGKEYWESARETGRQREFENLQRSENPGRSQWESFPFAGNMKFPRRRRSGLWLYWTGLNINIDVQWKMYCFSLLLVSFLPPSPSWCSNNRPVCRSAPAGDVYWPQYWTVTAGWTQCRTEPPQTWIMQFGSKPD